MRNRAMCDARQNSEADSFPQTAEYIYKNTQRRVFRSAWREYTRGYIYTFLRESARQKFVSSKEVHTPRSSPSRTRARAFPGRGRGPPPPILTEVKAGSSFWERGRTSESSSRTRAPVSFSARRERERESFLSPPLKSCVLLNPRNFTAFFNHRRNSGVLFASVTFQTLPWYSTYVHRIFRALDLPTPSRGRNSRFTQKQVYTNIFHLLCVVIFHLLCDSKCCVIKIKY